MLILSRQHGQKIYIGDDVVITVVDIRGDKTRIGIEAPADVPVHRAEVRSAIIRESMKSGEDPQLVKDRRNFTLPERIRNIISDARNLKFRDTAQLIASLEGALASAGV